VYILGNPANFANGELRTVPIPGNILANIYTGGPLVVLLIALSIMDVAIIFERIFSLKKQVGKDLCQLFSKIL